MKNFQIAAVAIGGIVLGAGGALGIQASIGPLHAEAAAPYYEVAEINVKDQARYEQKVSKSRDAIKANGGKLIAGGYNKANARMGAAPVNRVLTIRYPNKEAADKAWATGIQEWWDEDGKKHADATIFGVEGVEPNK